MMTIGYINELAAYNLWANNKVIEWCNELTTEQWQMPLVSSFESIDKTVLHTAGAELIWVDRFELKANPIWMPSIFEGDQNDTLSLWATASLRLRAYCMNLDNDALQKKFSYKRLNGDTFTHVYYQMLAHVINHSSYHRGQLVTMLRQVGFTDISSLDLSTFYNQQQKL